MRLRIGIDLMGGDNPPELLFPAILQAAKQLSSDRSLLVIATKPLVDHFSSLLVSLPKEIANFISFQICDEVIAMYDDPLTAVRHKKKSSLVMGMHLLKNNQIDAFVSCGNTGALIASAALNLPLLNSVSHPALLVTLPTKRGRVVVLDAGGNILSKSQHLVRFAFLGAAYQRALLGIAEPKVGLLNIGVESIKGTSEIREAYKILENYSRDAFELGKPLQMQFSGNIEARDLFEGSVDVLITDGFTGNILLKTAEGISSFIFESLQALTEGSPPMLDSVINELKKQFNYAEYPGALVCGVDGLVIKVHGNATAEALLISVFSAFEYIEKQVIPRIKQELSDAT